MDLRCSTCELSASAIAFRLLSMTARSWSARCADLLRSSWSASCNTIVESGFPAGGVTAAAESPVGISLGAGPDILTAGVRLPELSIRASATGAAGRTIMNTTAMIVVAMVVTARTMI